jgi:hypothetical protein
MFLDLLKADFGQIGPRGPLLCLVAHPHTCRCKAEHLRGLISDQHHVESDHPWWDPPYFSGHARGPDSPLTC